MMTWPTSPPAQLDRVGIIGGGTMGQGIAAAALTAGLDVTLVERDEASAEKAGAGIGKMLDGAVKRGKLAADARDRMLAQSFRAVIALRRACPRSIW